MNVYDVQREFQGTYTRTRTSTDLMVHHAAALYSTYRGIDDVRSVARFHTQTRQWPGIGYHICLAEETQDGPIARYNCSDLDLQRAHIAYRNHEFLGVACLTNFNDESIYPDKQPSQKWLDALAETLRDLKRIYPHAEVFGHKEMALPGWGTTCPGDTWHLWKPELLRMINTEPQPETHVIGVKASITQSQWLAFLKHHDAPESITQIVGLRIYNLANQLEIDTALLGAMWIVEQGFPLGGNGLGLITPNPLNIKAYGRWPTVEYKDEKWNAYESWQLGWMHTVMHLMQLYGAEGLLTVEQIIPKFAPRSDGNDVDNYINKVKEYMSDMQSS